MSSAAQALWLLIYFRTAVFILLSIQKGSTHFNTARVWRSKQFSGHLERFPVISLLCRCRSSWTEDHRPYGLRRPLLFSTRAITSAGLKVNSGKLWGSFIFRAETDSEIYNSKANRHVRSEIITMHSMLSSFRAMCGSSCGLFSEHKEMAKLSGGAPKYATLVMLYPGKRFVRNLWGRIQKTSFSPWKRLGSFQAFPYSHKVFPSGCSSQLANDTIVQQLQICSINVTLDVLFQNLIRWFQVTKLMNVNGHATLVCIRCRKVEVSKLIRLFLGFLNENKVIILGVASNAVTAFNVHITHKWTIPSSCLDWVRVVDPYQKWFVYPTERRKTVCLSSFRNILKSRVQFFFLAFVATALHASAGPSVAVPGRFSRWWNCL